MISSMIRTALGLALLPALAIAHSAMTIPQPRNAVDSDLKPWGGDVPHPLPFEPWCPIPSHSAVGKDDRNLTGSNGQACFWFSKWQRPLHRHVFSSDCTAVSGCAIGCDECDGSTRGPIPSFDCTLQNCTYTGKPIEFGPKAPICGASQGSMNATMCDPKQRTVNTAAACGAPDDFYYYSPWRAPGYAPVIDSCGSAGGRLPGQGAGGFGASYVNTTHATIGDLGSVTLAPHDTGVQWTAGQVYQVAWTLQANHGGGYSWRLCPASSKLDEDCFNSHPLQMVGQSMLRWGGEGGRTLPFDAVDVTTGTKDGVMWRKNPIPRTWQTKSGRWGEGSNQKQTGWGFQPVCEDEGQDQKGTGQSCTGEWGPYNMEIVDSIVVPEDLPAGEWVLSWRLDCEESNQIWQSCADLAIKAP